MDDIQKIEHYVLSIISMLIVAIMSIGLVIQSSFYFGISWFGIMMTLCSCCIILDANTTLRSLCCSLFSIGVIIPIFVANCWWGAAVIPVAIVLAVTINSAFSAVYEKRKYEFSIYKAIGFKSSQILKKIISEVFLLNGVGLALGSILCFLTIIIANYYLYPKGMSFLNVSVLGIVGTLVCNMLVVIPVIFFCWRRTKKYDVTIY